MKKSVRLWPLYALFAATAAVGAQTLPSSPDRPWKTTPSPSVESTIKKNPYLQTNLDPNQVYTLVALIDLAESHNPATRVAWENTKAQFERLGIARSALYPTVSAVVLASTLRQGVLFNTKFVRQTEGLYQPELELSYLVFDFGERNRNGRDCARRTVNDRRSPPIFCLTRAAHRSVAHS